MSRRFTFAALVILVFATLLASSRAIAAPLTNAQATTVAKQLGDTFAKALKSCNVPAVLDLYEDDAIVVWPGEGQEAKGKPIFEKLVTSTCKPSDPPLHPIGNEATAICPDYIINTGFWLGARPGPDGKLIKSEIRTSELIHKSGGRWRYAVDHASIGIAAPAPAPASTASPQPHK